MCSSSLPRCKAERALEDGLGVHACGRTVPALFLTLGLAVLFGGQRGERGDGSGWCWSGALPVPPRSGSTAVSLGPALWFSHRTL